MKAAGVPAKVWLLHAAVILLLAALQFVLSHPAVSVAIPGAKDATQARTNAAAGEKILDAAELQSIHKASPI